MKQLITYSVLLLLMFSAGSCRKQQDDHYAVTGDYMIVGRAGGFTANVNTTYYLITETQLRKDTGVNCVEPHENIDQFNFNVVLPDSQFHAVKGMLLHVPAVLLKMNGATIGDHFIDAGYTDVRTSVNGDEYHWIFEADLSKCSDEIQAFVTGAHSVFR